MVVIIQLSPSGVIVRTNVKKPPSKCGPTPWSDSPSLWAGYLTIFERCCMRPGFGFVPPTKKGARASSESSKASASKLINS